MFIEKLANNEILIICGSEQFSTYEGYGSTLKYDSDYRDAFFDEDSFGNRHFKSQIVAFDSYYYSFDEKLNQWRASDINREIVKAYAAFSATPNRLGISIHAKIATG